MSCDAPAFDVDLRHRVGGRAIVLAFRSDAALTALVGPSGAGKTSTLNLIAGLLRPDAGRIAVGGETLFDRAAGIDRPAHRRRAGYVFQDNRLFPHRDVRANLLYGHRLADPADRWMSLDEAVAFLGIDALLDRHPTTLSGGEARRVAIGRALLSGPRFLLLDEPLTSLDPPRAREILAVIERVRDELRLPILYVSHAPAEVDRLTDRVVRLAPDD